MDGVYYDAKGNLLGIGNEEEKTRHDLISRCELFNKLALVPAKDDVNEYASKVYSIIQQMPSVDGVEVVRCTNCKFYKGLAECELIGDCMGTYGYCEWGERKEEE